MKKLQSPKGFTLLEMLACVITLILVGGIVSAGMNLAVKAYNESVYESDSQMLESTLNLYICDILRHATIDEDEDLQDIDEDMDFPNIDKDKEKLVLGFTNVAYQIYGGNIKVSEKSEDGTGTFMVYETKNNDGVLLVGTNVYANTLYVSDFILTYNKDKHYFTGYYKIKSKLLEEVERQCRFTCRTIAEH